jgi:hypothetical protein
LVPRKFLWNHALSLVTQATRAQPRYNGPPNATFRVVNSVGIATSRVFGAESSPSVSLRCTLHTHRSPVNVQQSPPACLLDSDRGTFTRRIPSRSFTVSSSVPPLRHFPSAITMSAPRCRVVFGRANQRFGRNVQLWDLLPARSRLPVAEGCSPFARSTCATPPRSALPCELSWASSSSLPQDLHPILPRTPEVAHRP